jgi:hypothetical protein
MGFKTTSGGSYQFLKSDGTVASNENLMIPGCEAELISTTSAASCLIGGSTFIASPYCYAYKTNGVYYGCSISGLVNNSTGFDGELNFRKSSAPIIPSTYSYLYPYSPVLLLIEKQVSNTKNVARHMYIGTDGYLYTEGNSGSIMGTSSPYYYSSTYSYFNGHWFVFKST